MANIRLLGLEESIYTRIGRLALVEKEVDYTFEKVDIFGDNGPPTAYLKRHPFGKIPCLIRDDFYLYETGAITRYIDEMFTGPALQPTDPRARARMTQVVSIMDSYAYRPMVWDVFVQRVVIRETGARSDEAVISAALRPIGIVLEQLNHWLGEDQFLTGPIITLADLHTFPMLLYFVQTPEGQDMLASYPTLLCWLESMNDRPSVQTTESVYG